MPSSLRRSLLLAFLALFLVPSLAQASVKPIFDLSSPSGGPFPTDRFTTPDASQLTHVRVDLPKPDCGARPSDCADIDVLNDLDGFNLQPRISIPFTGEIDPASVSSHTVFLVRLSDDAVTGINQIVWEPAVDTLHVESDELLDQHTRYLLVVTTGIRDAEGHPVLPGMRHVQAAGSSHLGNNTYLAHLNAALARSLPAGVSREDVVVASLFTTQSATALLEQVRVQIKASTPSPASFLLGPGGHRTVFSLADVTSVAFTRQVRTSATPTAPMFTTSFVPTPALSIYPGSVGTIAFGAYDSPDYETAAKVIPAVGSATGVPAVQGVNRVQFNLFLPSGTPPAGGWPVAIFGHGFGDNMYSSPIAVASSMARRGIATIAINVVGHGGGPLGTLTVSRLSGPAVTLPAGGRGVDQDGNGAIDSTEGVNAAPPQTLVGGRDGLRQTVIDLMQLVREIEVGTDVDGNGTRDLDASRIFYFGQSFGGIYGTKFLAVEPNVRLGVPNVPGGAIVEIARLSPIFRPLVWLSLVGRVPPLANLPGLFAFDENIPLRNQPPLVNTVPGSGPIQAFIENTEWASQPGNPVAYAPHLRKAPLAGVPQKSVILQFARGDQTVPNPTTSAIIRAGALQSQTTLFRNDLAFAANPEFPKNPHTFLTRIAGVATPVIQVALAAQDQIALFFASGGTIVADPDGPGPLFETPMVGPPPEDLAYIP
ncbi:MAG: Ig-like domain-containing protein [Actinobacteria bacterium]|nr:Ig-like domain-containing protein [Actinomycetota bacterium]